MAVEIGTAYLAVLPSAKGFGKSLTSQVASETKGSGEDVGKRFGGGLVASAAKFAAPLAAAFAGVKVVDFLKDSVGEAREAQKVGAITAATIKATGGAAKVSADQIGDLATKISLKTGIDDEAIQSGANLLLTFKNVRNEAGKGGAVFDRATQAAADLSAAGFGSIESSSKMLGKALNDPIKGVSALSRAGVTFTDQQKDQIKTLVKSGDTLGAQKLIMKEVEGQVGGVAAASATAGEKFAVAFGNLKEQVGTALLPVIDKVAATLTEKVIPAISGFIAGMLNGSGAGGQFVAFITGAGNALATFGGFVAQNRDVLIPLVGAIVAGITAFQVITGIVRAFTAVQAALNVVMSLNPISLVVIAIAALVAGFILAYKHSETFRAIVQAVFGALKTVALAVFNWFATAVPAVIAFVRDHWRTVANILTAPVQLAWAGIKLAIAGVQAVFSAVGAWIRGTFATIWRGLKKIFTDPVDAAKTVIATILGKTGLQKVFSSAVSAIGKIWDGLKEAAKAPVRFVIQTVINDGLINGFNSIASHLPGKLSIPRIPLPKGFSEGGYTGAGHRLLPAGIVHAGEVVFDQDAVAAAGGAQKLDAFRRALKTGMADLPGFTKGGVVWPTNTKRLSGNYPGHSGVDIAAGQGAPIYAATNGSISYTGWGHGYGQAIFERAANGLAMVYGHTSKVLTHAGASVKAGQKIGLVGATGRATGPHLHFEIAASGFGTASNRAATLRWLGGANIEGGGGFVESLLDKVGGAKKILSTLSAPLDKLKEITDNPFGQLVAAVPRALKDAMLKKFKDVIPGFAGGTRSAPRGPAWVGERGPEIVNFRGGESVYTARESASIAGAAAAGTQVIVQGDVLNDALLDALVDALDRRDRRAKARANFPTLPGSPG